MGSDAVRSLSSLGRAQCLAGAATRYRRGVIGAWLIPVHLIAMMTHAVDMEMHMCLTYTYDYTRVTVWGIHEEDI